MELRVWQRVSVPLAVAQGSEGAHAEEEAGKTECSTAGKVSSAV
jgi:hypothetical protein